MLNQSHLPYKLADKIDWAKFDTAFAPLYYQTAINFELSVEELAQIYKRRWAIETLYKQLKQNFPLHFFYGESVNAIQIQTWVVLIANLLCTVLSRMIKRHVSFSQIVTMLRLTLMYYSNFIDFMENPQKDECAIWAERAKAPPQEPSLFD